MTNAELQRYVIQPVWSANNSYWQYDLMRGRPGRPDARDLFAPAPLNFLSHNGLGDFAPLVASASIPHPTGRRREPVVQPSLHHGELPAPRQRGRACARRAMIRDLEATGRVVKVHQRRGDSAMHRECASCVAADEPDVRSDDRVPLDAIRRELTSLNLSLSRTDGEGIVSDTLEPVSAARSVLTAAPVAWQSRRGPALHSTLIADVGAASSLMADFVLTAIADELVPIDDSSLSGCAESLSGRALSAR